MKQQLNRIRQIILASYGRCLTRGGPISFDEMIAEEKEALLQPMTPMIDEDIRMISEVVADVDRRAVGRVFSHFRQAEGVDAEMIDQIMEQETMEPGKIPVGV